MAPPPRTPRLAQLDAEKLARDTVLALGERLSELARHYLEPKHDLDPSERSALEKRALETPLGRRIVELVAYAREGKPPPGGARKALGELAGALAIMAPGEHGPGSELDPSEVGLLLRAALGRVSVAEGELLRAGELSALAGLSVTQVRNLIGRGELKARDGAVSADEAARWLASRGVPGFARRNR